MKKNQKVIEFKPDNKFSIMIDATKDDEMSITFCVGYNKIVIPSPFSDALARHLLKEKLV